MSVRTCSTAHGLCGWKRAGRREKKAEWIGEVWRRSMTACLHSAIQNKHPTAASGSRAGGDMRKHMEPSGSGKYICNKLE
ncbi:hypothetical protein MHYP_G00294460 [Metynnis hypsauchen]